jgi:outer membrane protein OmpA-like peptidoglycan-associated protein
MPIGNVPIEGQPIDEMFAGNKIADVASRAETTKFGNTELPIAVSPDSVIWRDTGDVVTQLATEYVTMQADSDHAMFDALNNLVETMHDLGVDTAQSQPPPQILGRITQPDGSAAPRLQVSLAADGLSTDDARHATAITNDDGSFVLPIPTSARARVNTLTADLLITGGSGGVTLTDPLGNLQTNGFLPAIALSEPLTPLPISVVVQLQKLIDSAPSATPTPAEHALPALSMGEDECEIVFRKDTSVDRFPYGVMFRLTDPTLSQPSLVFDFRKAAENPFGSRLSYYGAISPAAALLGQGETLGMHLAQRVSVDRPISVDAFRTGLAVPNFFGGVPIAGSLAIGYVVKMAQRWTALGLALGDLVYSLPLAPGEQQRIAVVERTATSTVIDSETLDTSEALSFAEADDTSATATFASAFNEAASGGTHYDTQASSYSAALSLGGFGIFPFGCLAGGLAASFGHSQSSGNTNTWMSGARDYTSDAAQRTHSSVQRQAAARRHSSRTAMRLATATETDQVVTKVIANHNKTRALTMQYWEVQRMFDVGTAVEGVNLVCMVPLDVVRFLPFGLPTDLQTAPATRADVLQRYDQLLRHADILARVVPSSYQRGLSLITDFAADPTTTVATSDAPAEDVLQFSLKATFLPFDEAYVTIVGKRGVRVGPVRLTGDPPPTPPIPNPSVFPAGSDAFSTEEELFAELRKRRSGIGSPFEMTANVALPAFLPRQDIVGFEISRRTQRLDYHFAPRFAADLKIAQGLLGPLGVIENLVQSAIASPSVSKSYTADKLEQEIGGPRPTAFSVAIPAGGGNPPTPAVNFVSTNWSGGSVELPRATFPVASRTIPPLLSYASVLEIEKTLQWAIRNTMTCSVAVFASLTPEERAVMLERYQIPLPPDDKGVPQAVPLLSCVTNNVLGYYGNSMVLPFIIPAEITERTTVYNDARTEVVKPGITTAQIQDALTRFHTDGFDPPRATIALPTKGVLGEGVLGHCPSAEKIDLTRFWNWQDSPGDEATAISPLTVPSASLTAGLSAPNSLPGMSPIITNFNTSPVAADTSLAAALTTLAGQQKDFDIGALTNAAGLTTLSGKTIDTAESARKDALKSATDLASKAMETAASIYTGGSKDKKSDGKDKKSGGTSDSGGTGTGSGSGDPGSGGNTGGDDGDPATTFSVFFELDKTDINDASGAGQVNSLDLFILDATAHDAENVVVRGYASPEGPKTHNVDLAHARADAVIAHLIQEGLLGATRAEGGVLTGPPGDYPRLRRADISLSYPEGPS